MAVGTIPSQAIRDLIENDHVTALTEISPNQIQPASFDLRLGSMSWCTGASMVPSMSSTVERSLGLTRENRIHTDGIDIQLTPNVPYVVKIAENLRLPYNISAKANAKSTTGRLDVFARLMVDGVSSYDRVPAGYSGPLYVELISKSFKVRLRAGECVNQIRFHRGGYWPSRHSTLHIDLDGTTCGYVADHYGTIVNYRETNHPWDEYWSPCTAKGGELLLVPGRIYIMRSLEKISIGSDEAAEVRAVSPEFGELRVHYAGFIDPGFTGRVVFEIRAYDTPIVLRHGQPIGIMVTEHMAEVPEALYGQNGKNHYQDQGLKLARQFC